MRHLSVSAVTAIALALVGLLFSQWLLVLAGVLIALLCGNVAVAAILALAADLVFGAPTGRFHVIPVPFLIGTLLLGAARVALTQRMRDSMPSRL